MTSFAPANLDALIAEAMEEWQVPGLAVAVARDGEPDWAKGYGLRDVEASLPVTVDTQFILCSITKSFTALGLAMLVDEGRLDWLRPARDYLPEFRLRDDVATHRVTVRDLLCHHWGMPRHDWVWMTGDFTRAEMFAALRHLEPSEDIRAEFQYCNLGYVVLGMIAERLSGQSWEAFTRERILEPLGMIHTGFSHEDLQGAPDGARPYVLSDRERPGEFVRRRAPLWPISETPAGGVNASASEMAKYMRLYLAKGDFGGARLVSEGSLKAMQAPRVYTGPSEFAEYGDMHYGLGLGAYSYRGERVVGHSGGWFGWSTLMSWMPERNCGVTVLTNRAENPLSEIITNAIFDHVCEKEPVPRLDRHRRRRRAFIADRPADEAVKREARRKDAPRRPLGQYVGEYAHPAYGRIGIAADGEALHCRFRNMTGALAHRHFDMFEFTEQPEMLWPDNLGLTFLYDREGSIDRLSIPLEPRVADIVFRRVASGEALDPAFRALCVGTYRGGPITHVVALDADGALTLSPTGQPTYPLLPYRERLFSIRELEHYRVEFVVDCEGAPNRIVFHQPDGTFQAQRVRLG